MAKPVGRWGSKPGFRTAPKYGALGSKQHYRHFLRERAKLIKAGKHGNPSVDPRAEYQWHVQTNRW